MVSPRFLIFFWKSFSRCITAYPISLLAFGIFWLVSVLVFWIHTWWKSTIDFHSKHFSLKIEWLNWNWSIICLPFDSSKSINKAYIVCPFYLIVKHCILVKVYSTRWFLIQQTWQKKALKHLLNYAQSGEFHLFFLIAAVRPKFE